jgi:hypothetical protein
MKHPLRIEDLHVSTFAPEFGQPLSPVEVQQQITMPAQQMTGTDSCWGSWCYPQTFTETGTA